MKRKALLAAVGSGGIRLVDDGTYAVSLKKRRPTANCLAGSSKLEVVKR